jgi:hypothetical protein
MASGSAAGHVAIETPSESASLPPIPACPRRLSQPALDLLTKQKNFALGRESEILMILPDNPRLLVATLPQTATTVLI